MSVTSLRTKLAALAATGVMALGTGVLAASPATASDHTVDGCPSGYGCIYTPGWGSHTVDVKFNAAGTYNLSNKNDWRWVLNNQTGGWKFKLCTGYNGTGSCEDMPLDQWRWRDITPINSVVVSP
ncbi:MULTISPECIES: hypothetical protein [Streptomyces]|uniref:Peptidase inhibitor family I36 n=1 Tax=Streptomyces flavotricini TaxID=66888 RepID=A0ABS8E7P8_9ACTN|nr:MULTISPECIES: hypothetical protein [Streptomyces]MCC0097023.1 hypothetical protein [Streptomyces flavotricini]WSI25453.1 hypothetical protein OG311_19880 [Streptomyces sp. NBC_01343]